MDFPFVYFDGFSMLHSNSIAKADDTKTNNACYVPVKLYGYRHILVLKHCLKAI